MVATYTDRQPAQYHDRLQTATMPMVLRHARPVKDDSSSLEYRHGLSLVCHASSRSGLARHGRPQAHSPVRPVSPRGVTKADCLSYAQRATEAGQHPARRLHAAL